ncbi:MAG: kelch repeat-containing protein [Gemmatimonadota bacterium]|jgi:hypothetical protein
MKDLLALSLFLFLGGLVSPLQGQKPDARIYHTMVEADQGRIVLMGGTSKHGWTMDRDDSWVYDLRADSWAPLGPNEPKEIFAAAYDRQSRRIIAFNLQGETWALDPIDGSWEQRTPSQAPSTRCGERMVYDADSDRVILFGGFGCTSASDPMFNDTWSYDYESDSWTLHETAKAPPPRCYHDMVYHSPTDQVVLWGGRVEDSRVWVFDLEDESWTDIEISGGPEGIRSYYTMASVPQTGSILVFGGLVVDEPMGMSGRMLNEMWYLNLNDRIWNRIETEDTPTIRSHHAMATHSPTGQLVVFGGELEAPYSDNVSDELWIYDPVTHRWKRR